MSPHNSQKRTEKSSPELIEIEVCYALPDRQELLKLRVAAGISALDCIRASGIEESFAGFDLANSPVGVFGKLVNAADYQPQAGDRLEIYRPLIADPRDRRRQQASSQKKAAARDSAGGREGKDSGVKKNRPRKD